MKKILLSLTMVLAIVALASCSLNSKTTIEFSKLPETVYEAGDYSEEEIKAKLETISVKVSGVDTEINLTNNILTVSGFDAATLKTPGTYNLVVVYGSASVVFNYTVVAKVEPQKVSTDVELETALAKGGVIELEGNINTSKTFLPTKSVIIYGNGHKLETSHERAAFDFKPGVSNVNFIVNDLNITCSSARAITLYTTNNVSIKLENCDITAKNYTICDGGLNNGTKIEINNSKVKGWACINIWSKNIELKATKSEFNSYNHDGESFGAVVLNGGNRDPQGLGFTAGNCGQDCQLTFDTCKFNVEFNNFDNEINADQSQCLLLIQDSCAGNVINFNNCDLSYYEDMFYVKDFYNPAANYVYIDGERQ